MNIDTRPSSAPLRRNLDFSLLLLAQGLSVTGRGIGNVVLPLLVLALTDSATRVGLIAAAQAVPYVLVSLPAGALVDRWNRKRIMLVCEYVRATALLSLPAAWLVYDLHLAHLYLVAIATGVAFVFYNIAEIAAIPQVVPKERLPQALSAANVVEWAGELSGPAVGGVLVGMAKTTLAGAMLAYLVQGAMQLVWAVGMLVMPWFGSLYILALGWAIVASVAGVYDVVATSFRLALIPDAMQGRVNSVFRCIGFGIRPVTLAIGGFLIAALGPRETLWILASGMVLTAVLTALSSLRSADEELGSSVR